MFKKLFLIISILLFVLSACAPKSTAAPASGSGTFEVNKFTGTYAGTWENQQTGASGPVTITIVADEATRTATITLDFGGNFLGLGDPPAASVTATYDDHAAYVKGNNVFLGEMDITIDAEGNISGLVKNLGGGAIPSVTYTGKIGNGRMDADYLVTFKDGSTATALLRTAK